MSPAERDQATTPGNGRRADPVVRWRMGEAENTFELCASCASSTFSLKEACYTRLGQRGYLNSQHIKSFRGGLIIVKRVYRL